MINLLCRPDLIVGAVITELGNLSSVRVIGTHTGKDQVVVLNSYHSRWQNQSLNQNSLICIHLKCWLVNHSVPRSEMNGKCLNTCSFDFS